ncbi:hypothetical protein [Novosphingobium sp. EMRT-2]|uniref:hypothetical protein n=1 Tax=Novosphingobium sp. EMRT-2 TaxID=2571749 RepID=UPI0010BDC2C0|nr:hypothetical protein [Novosphingobium sp. EMRT-2]QCI92445.1 hypothetical protein FA702_01985 [Novosphingobium sp. EMRT-2]
MTDAATIDTARQAAARHLRDGGFEAEAAMVSEGRGDDFVEVRIALSLLRILGERPARSAPPVKRNGRRLVGEEC